MKYVFPTIFYSLCLLYICLGQFNLAAAALVLGVLSSLSEWTLES